MIGPERGGMEGGIVVQRVSQKAKRAAGNEHAAYCTPRRMKSATRLQRPGARGRARARAHHSRRSY